jgi:malate dehydrogenase (oxaloacetate-decarboxylating)
MGKLRVVINGAGAAGIAIGKHLIAMGFGNIIMCDINGIICEGDANLNSGQEEISHISNLEKEHGKLADAMKGADIFVGVSRPNLVSKEMVASMNNGIVFAMANPVPEIMPDEAKAGGAAVVGSGRSDFANQINNILVFPGLFKGLLAVRAKEVTDSMKVAASHALADLIPEEELRADYVIVSSFDERAALAVANAVAKEAERLGLNRVPYTEIK